MFKFMGHMIGLSFADKTCCGSQEQADEVKSFRCKNKRCRKQYQETIGCYMIFLFFQYPWAS